MNIGEIAKRAGASRSTVSYVLSGKRAVSEETRRRILAVIEELDYRPNAAARALKEGRTRTLGLVIPPASQRLTDMQLGFVASVVEAAARADLDVLLSPSGGDHERSFERVVTGRRVDGVILMEIRMEDDRVSRLRQTSLPFVTIGRTADPHDMWWVDVDYTTLISRCVHHLADLGHRHLAFINRSAELVAAGYGPGHRALAGFRQAVTERGLTGVDVCCPDEPSAGETCLEQLRAAHPEVTAVATINEAALPGIQRGLQHAGLAVPRDFSVAGVAARHWAEDFRPPLTAADVPTLDMGEEAVRLLLERIATPEAPPRHVLHAPPISLRASTGPVPPALR
ncbi:LacI family DNA-binding transcriptional regulator [Dactylosporangium aurantiacum]|uniref:LacI family DNA-binding transcriptional regulator n=1 Tax=Dactylosporangium aurantiacum TaxID=35754 RepID=A0A9Q9ILU6_9ACTN|nr:LacI family DNA-binding transcriptional regulator [Dactylosporangium aurantiacum]MDG6105769.1 LacI family DNA-binding transcriptional regulator [Dactylosporangium aurantiacum]UWZ58041.1 LacI family DNA-binding transcriptional regulator [Dactylosporangium aurantiacum]